ncbi:VIT domain-containing protein [Nannocystis radixulma]|uniref:VIT domain-containing protein n=1 Tax=Nannocystis radixulma TaxID=2995305 RepID=A0ABT5BG49_9BACT|nr:VIT domain-containing protein [Nannocystis radixulma]MDC0673115.1 VIT domain-containing protein [Nannocystis radixulma]
MARFGSTSIAVAALALACGGPSASSQTGPDLANLAAKTGADEPIRREPPISLTAADGAELPLRVLRVRAVLDQPLAFTELELAFDNPEGRTLAGRLALAIPPGARVTRFAAWRDGAWQEAEVVPRRTAIQQLALGDAPQEPQLVGAPEGERFVARVEPIAAREQTRLIVAYTQEMRGRNEPYRVPLAGLAPLRELAVAMRSRAPLVMGGDPLFAGVRGDGEYYRFADVRPTGDILVQPHGPRELGLRHDNMVVARISPIPHDHPDPIESLAILFDTSASQSLGWDTHVDRLGQLIQEIGARVLEDIPLRVVAFDQGVELAYEGPIRSFDAEALAAIRARRPLGASNLLGALRFAARVGERPARRLVVMTDGLITAGAHTEAALIAEAERLRTLGVARLDVIVEGGAADPALLRGLTALTRLGARPETMKALGHELAPARPGLVLRSGVTPRIAAHRLTRTVVRDVEVRVPGSGWVYPQKLDSVQAGDDVLVYAEYAEDELEVELVGHEVAARHGVTLTRTPSPLLQDAWAGARASWLIDQARSCARGPDDTCDKFRARAVEFSLSNRIVNDATAMVVIGSAHDYARFGLDGTSLRDVLAVGKFGAEWREAAPVPLPDERAAPPAHALLAELRMSSFDAEPAPASAAAPPVPPVPPVRTRRSSRPGPKGPVRENSRAEAADELAREDARDRLRDKDAGLRFGPQRTPADAYEGNFLAVMNLLGAWDDKRNALGVAERWQRNSPADVTALVALGEALEANGRDDLAARAYGSLIDLYPGRPDVRRMAASRLERTGEAAGWLVLDAYSRAVEQRYDDPAGYRLYAYALLRAGYFGEAWAALLDGMAWARVEPKTRGLERVFKDDLGLVAAAWIRRWPDQREYVLESLRVQEAELADKPSLRFVLSWDSEQGDVDLHVRDGHGWHAFYRQKSLESGGRLLDDMDAGYGLEAFVIDGAAQAYPYRLEVGYYGRNADYGAGKVQIVEHDGEGQLYFDERPFLVLKQRGYVDLGALTGSLAPAQARAVASLASPGK